MTAAVASLCSKPYHDDNDDHDHGDNNDHNDHNNIGNMDCDHDQNNDDKNYDVIDYCKMVITSTAIFIVTLVMIIIMIMIIIMSVINCIELLPFASLSRALTFDLQRQGSKTSIIVDNCD